MQDISLIFYSSSRFNYCIPENALWPCKPVEDFEATCSITILTRSSDSFWGFPQ